MSAWAKVVMQPLGLAGFALFIVFTFLARIRRRDERRWIIPVLVAMAVVALGGGITLAYLNQKHQPATANNGTMQQQPNFVKQETTGAGSPTVQGVQGDVSITVDQSGTGGTEPATAHKTSPSDPNIKKK